MDGHLALYYAHTLSPVTHRVTKEVVGFMPIKTDDEIHHIFNPYEVSCAVLDMWMSKDMSIIEGLPTFSESDGGFRPLNRCWWEDGEKPHYGDVSDVPQPDMEETIEYTIFGKLKKQPGITTERLVEFLRDEDMI
jgi:hypothetical protein